MTRDVKWRHDNASSGYYQLTSFKSVEMTSRKRTVMSDVSRIDKLVNVRIRSDMFLMKKKINRLYLWSVGMIMLEKIIELILCCLRPYHDEHTRSRPITAVKHRRAGIVLGLGPPGNSRCRRLLVILFYRFSGLFWLYRLRRPRRRNAVNTEYCICSIDHLEYSSEPNLE